MNNIKLNIFEYYKQADSVPIENNMTKNFAIVLKECPIVLNTFISSIHKNIKQNNGKELNIDAYIENSSPMFILQKSANTIIKKELYFDEIIGVTLTTEETPILENSNNKIGTENPIPDLIISYRNKLYVIEVKRNNTNAEDQLRGQLKALVINEESLKDSEPLITHLSWTQVIDIMYDVKEKIENSNFILNEYLEHVEYRNPGITNIKNFEKVFMNNKAQFFKRLKLAGDNMSKEENCYTVTNEHIWIDIKGIEYLKRLTISSLNTYSVMGHLANNISQGKSLYYNHSNNFLDKKEIIIDGKPFKISFTPYIKISNSFGSYLGEAPLINEEGQLEYSEIASVFKGINGRYDKLSDRDIIKVKIDKVNNDDSKIKVDFYNLSEVFEETNYNTITLAVSIKFEIEDVGNHLQEIDSKFKIGSNEEDPISNFFKQSAEAIRLLVEGIK